MIDKNELTNEIIKKFTNKIGTNISKYLDNFFEWQQTNKNQNNLLNKTFEDFLKDKNITKKTTTKNNQKILEVFDILKLNENIFNEEFLYLNDFEEYIKKLSKKLQEKISNYFLHNLKKSKKFFTPLIISLLKYKKILTNNYIDLKKIFPKNFIDKKQDFFSYWELNKKEEYKSIFENIHIDINEEYFFSLISSKFIYTDKENLKTIYNKKIKIIPINKQNYEKKITKIENENSKNIKINLTNFIFFIDYIKNNQQKIKIPFFQRNYVWDKNNIFLFLNSILKNNYFLNLNSIYLVYKPKEINEGDLLLIDGQQRITTLFLILFFLIKELGESKFISISNLFEKGKKIEYFQNMIISFFEVLNINNNYFKELKSIEFNLLFEEKNVLNDNIKNNFKNITNFLNFLEEEDKLNILYKILGIEFISIIEETKSEIKKFIELNSNSKPLTDYELLRAFLLDFFQNNINSFEIEHWIINFENLFSEEKNKELLINDFFSFFLKIKLKKNINNKKYFLDFENYFNSIPKEQINILLTDILEYVELFLIIWKGNIDFLELKYKNKNIIFFKYWLYAFKKQKIYMPILLHLFFELNKKDFIDKIEIDEIIKFLFHLEIFHFKWKIIDFNGESLTNIFISLLSNIDNYFYSYKDLYKILFTNSFLKSILSEDKNSLSIEIFNIDFKNNDLPLFILLRLKIFKEYGKDIYYKKFYQDNFNIEYSKLSIEHIYPKNPKSNDLNLELNKKSNKIFNLLILNQKSNSSLGNKNLSEKYEFYQKNNVFYFNNIKNIDSNYFNNENIFNFYKERKESLSNLLIDLLSFLEI